MQPLIVAGYCLILPTLIFVSLIGGFLPLLRELSQKALALFLSFSAGVLLGAGDSCVRIGDGDVR